MAVNRLWFPNIPSSGIDAADRQQIAIGYSGILATGEETVDASYILIRRRRRL